MGLSIKIKGQRPAGSSYWAITSYSWDKQSNKTTINLAGWESQDVRKAMFPAADDRRFVTTDGVIASLADCYVAVKANDEEFKDATDN